MTETDDSVIYSESWQLIYSLILANVTDPITPARTKWIYANFPDEAIEDMSYYPIITISNTKINNINIDTTDRNTKTFTTYNEITVYSRKSTELDSISGSITHTLNSNETYFGENAYFNIYTTTDNDQFTNESGKRIHARTIQLTMEKDIRY